MKFNADRVWEIVISVLLACAGGMAKMLSVKGEKKLRLGYIFSQLFIAAFAGVVVLLLSRALGLKGDWLFIMASLAGWLGSSVIDLIANKYFPKLGIVVRDEDEKK